MFRVSIIKISAPLKQDSPSSEDALEIMFMMKQTTFFRLLTIVNKEMASKIIMSAPVLLGIRNFDF